MRLVDVEAFALRAPFSGDAYWGARSWADSASAAPAIDPPAFARWQPAYEQVCATTVVRLRTDTGLVGWGECKAPVVPEIARDVIHELLRPAILGSDPRDVLPLWDRMYGCMSLRNQGAGFFLEALSAVDIALWDLNGEAAGLPISTLLGGAYRARIPVYASGVVGLRSADDDPARVAEETRAFVARGFHGVKIAIGHGIDLDVRSIEAAAEEAGGVALLADTAARYNLSQATRLLPLLEPYGLFLLEAPLPAELRAGYATLRRTTSIPLSNDLVGARWAWLDLLREDGVDVIAPDVSRAGGLSECRRIAAIGEAFGVACSPHMSVSSVIHQAACAHFAASLPDLALMEYWTGTSPLSDDVGTRLLLDDGMLQVPPGAGLGIEIDEQRLLAHAC
jgi:D-arabinonate dehydratase/D-galactarolactone cycloisomerase